MKIVTVGATGFVGSHLLKALSSSSGSGTPHQITVLSRDPDRTRDRVPSGLQLLRWDPLTEAVPERALDGADAVINLAGDNVAEGRWTPAKKKRLVDSRILTTRGIVDAIGDCEARPRILVNASAIGFYGPRGDEELGEQSAAGDDFLSGLCQQWEAEASRATEIGVRTVLLRIGIVLGVGGGALKKMLLPFRLGAGGPIGSGRQWMSWIHIDDMVGLILHALSTENLTGPVNATAPQPATNRKFSSTLGRVLRRPAFLPAPGFALRLALGEFADILIEGQKVLPAKAEASGYEFRHPELEEALRDILG